jgi:hypothetical protein
MKKKYPDTLQQLHTILSSTVEKKLKVELDEFFTDFDIKDKLDTLDRLDAEQAALSDGETVWLVSSFLFTNTNLCSNNNMRLCYQRRPTGLPSKDLLAYDMPDLQQHKEDLLKYLKEVQTENALEKTKILKKVEEIQETDKVIEDMLMKNEKTSSVLGSTSTL